MRLLDLIVQGHCPSVYSDHGSELPNALWFTNDVRGCPLRLVMSDELTRCATQLAFAEGDRLSSCLDLIRIPARSIWVEWSGITQCEALRSIPAFHMPQVADYRHAGALISASADGRSGQLRTFWSTPDEQALLSPMITEFDLDRQQAFPVVEDKRLWRGETALTMEGEPAIEELLGHLRLRFDEPWARYYQQCCDTEPLKRLVLERSLGACAFNAPMLMGLFLLFGARDMLPRQEIRHERLNLRRRQAGKAPLLEHIEVSAPLEQPPQRYGEPSGEHSRLSPRLHHVRGHIVRRGSTVYWRSPHLRGSARMGEVRSRTVVLTYGSQSHHYASALH